MDYKKLDLPNTNYPSKEQLKAFETAFNAFLETNPQENENHHNDAFNDLLKGVFKYKVKPTEKIDSAILNENNEVEVIIEFKALKNPNEFIKKGDLNVKAFHESLLYYLRERKGGNNNLKHLILATIKELYIIDANEFEVFNKDKEIEKAFKNCHDRKGNDTRTKAFYDACQKRLNELDRSLKYHHISLKKENLALIYQALSPNFLLKIPKYSDANTLNKDFYEELLYILGLEEKNEKGKTLIKPSRTKNSLSYALKEQYKNLDDEEVMALLIAWNNRILFLRLLESLLISFNHFEKPFLTTENFKDFNALNALFFEVLAKKNSERLPAIKENKILEKIPYLNSSLFDQTPLELKGYKIRSLDNEPLEIYPKSVLKKHEEYQKQKDLPLLKYLFEFLRVYDFTTTPKDIKDNQNKSESRLINPSVLGLVFEKLNGYKEGSFYTPSFITSYMCKESITPIVLDKFNQKYNIECEDLEELKNYLTSYKKDERKEYLQLLLTLRICDPAVGSGHFLVSALNEMVWIAYELGLIASLYRHDLKLENDEIIIHTPENKVFNYTIPPSENDPHHQIQKELFELKKSIIENCLFGVDINPNSCEITKLRLWIELLKYSYYIFEDGKNTNALETLPNIDINIKCANSLIFNFPLNSKLTIGQTLEFSRNLKAEIKEYKNSVMFYKEGLGEKAKILQNIAKLKSLIINYFIEQHQANEHLKETLKAFISEYGDEIFDISTAFGMEMLKIARKNNYRFNPTLTKKQPSPIGVEANRLLIKIKECYETLENLKNSKTLEWRFEFPEVLNDEGDFLGFDCIIGNPPYIRQEQIKDIKPLLEKQYQDFYNSTADIYTYFFALSYHLLKEKGFNAFITSNKYARAKYGAKLRELLLKKTTLVSYMELNALKVFESATVDTSIIHFIKQAPLKESVFNYYEPTPNDKDDLKSTPSLSMKQNALSTESFIFANATLLDLRDKMESVGIPLKDWDIQIYRGILTGCNEAFIIPTEKRDAILNACKTQEERKHTEALIKPILRGKDIKRYSYEWAHLWVIFIPWHFPNTDNPKNMEENEQDFSIHYPIIYAHLLSHKDKLLKRNKDETGKRYEWYCLQRWAANYLQDFEKEKIVYGEIVQEPRFYLDNGECELGYFYAEATSFILTGEHLHYLLGMLHSKLITFAFKTFYAGGGLGESGYRYKKAFIERLPIPKITPQNQELAHKITDGAKQILALKEKDPKANTQELEKEIDALVYQLYNLTDEEIKIIEEGQ
ncbi:class I SAM-dependent DNA methyltransferase [Helicobacter pylori]|uniref:type IIG restriction enzyme/methyltransferase n=1 Tax=Helicobacter pylori TaxID=210 RepID=UPI00165A4275|nr:class I SAM-dependent DNA methyltransferase [Helicobacter pylori]MBH0227970.1 class I SAM-dependent DNA methyltransferase [Helicobacter pylori]